MAWNGSDGAATPRMDSKTKPNAMRGLVAGVVVVAGVGAAFWLMFRSGDNAGVPGDNKAKHGRIAEATPDIAEERTVQEPPAPPPKDDPRRPHTIPLEKWNGLTAQQKGMIVKLGRQKIHETFTNDTNSADGPSVARNHTEQVMLMVFGTPLGEMPLPMPDIPKKDMKNMAAILLQDFEASDDDTDDSLLDKEIITEAKAALREYIREGGTVEDFFSYYHNKSEMAYRTRRDAAKMVYDAAKSQSESEARELFEALNKKLSEEGIKPLVFPEAALKGKRK